MCEQDLRGVCWVGSGICGSGADGGEALVLVAPRMHWLLEGRSGPPTEEVQYAVWVDPGFTGAVGHSFTGSSGAVMCRNKSRHFWALSCAGLSTRLRVMGGQPCGPPVYSLGLGPTERIWFSLRMCAKGVSHTVFLASQVFHELALPI